MLKNNKGKQMNETEYIKEAVVRECVNSFINSVQEFARFETIEEQQQSIITWSQALHAAIALQKSDLIIKPFTKDESLDLYIDDMFVETEENK